MVLTHSSLVSIFWLIVKSQALRFLSGTMTSGQTLHTAPILATVHYGHMAGEIKITSRGNSTVGGQILTAFTEISVHFLLTFVLQLQLLIYAVREDFSEHCSRPSENIFSAMWCTHSKGHVSRTVWLHIGQRPDQIGHLHCILDTSKTKTITHQGINSSFKLKSTIDWPPLSWDMASGPNQDLTNH